MAPFASSIFQSNVLNDSSLFDLLTIETFALIYSLPSLALMNWLPESQLRSIDLTVTSLPSKAIVSPTLKVVFSVGLFSEVALLLFVLTTVALFCCDALDTPITIITIITQNHTFLKIGFFSLVFIIPSYEMCRPTKRTAVKFGCLHLERKFTLDNGCPLCT